MSTPTVQRQQSSKLYGLTHNPVTGAAIIREPRVLKVGIGIPKGRAISIYIYRGKWTIRYGAWEDSGGKKKLVMKTMAQLETREEAEAYHRANKEKAAVSNRPQKLPFFTFSKRHVVEEAGKLTEVFEPDFHTIEAHGETPKEINVVLMSDNPLTTEYQMWSSSELKCHGDGINALRVVSMGKEPDPLWKEAVQRKDKYFPIVGGCWTGGCPFQGEGCKPNATLNFQLANAMRIGATAYLTTTSFRSISQMFSAIEGIKEAVNRRGYSMVGIPLTMVLGSFKSNHEGKPAIQPCISLELRAENMRSLNRLLQEESWTPAQIAETQRQIAAAVEGEVDVEVAAPAMSGEFYPEVVDDDEEPTQETGSVEAAASVADKKLEQMRRDAGPETAEQHDARLESQMAEQLATARESGEDPGFFGEPVAAQSPAPPAKTGFRMGRKP